jgi:protein TonB
MESSISSPNVSASDRLSMTLFLAVVVHGILILGISFNQGFLQSDSLQRTMDIILVQTKSDTTPEDAKRMAQHNQEASGSQDTPDTPSNPFTSPIPTPNTGEATNPQEARTSKTKQVHAQQILHTSGEAIEKIPSNVETLSEQTALVPEEVEQESRQTSIAQLSSEIEVAEKKYAERPKIHFIDALSAKSAVEAKYTNDWVERVENIGNLNYPEDARRDRITGKLVLNVLLDNDGKVLKIQIAISSGNGVLDEAAKQIIRLSSPFPKFPEEMKQAYDQLMITRTWVFDPKIRVPVEEIEQAVQAENTSEKQKLFVEEN